MDLKVYKIEARSLQMTISLEMVFLFWIKQNFLPA